MSRGGRAAPGAAGTTAPSPPTAKIVYHLDGAATHAFRFAKTGERAEAWDNGGWDKPNLVALDKLKSGNSKACNALKNSDRGSVNFPLQDKGDRFWTTMSRAKPAGIGFTPTYNAL